jgi:pSer/pThr/pTyr-binding forkhead associated (FHA) protein
MTTPSEVGGPPPAGAMPGSTRLDAGALLRRAATGGAALAGPHLVVREPRAGERVVALAAGCTVGRGRLAVLRLADPSASRLHLRLRLDAGGATVQDLGSRNGLRVNGGRARGRCRLRSGDELEVGETLLRYVDPLESSGEAPARKAPGPPRPSPAALLAVAAGLLLLAALALALGRAA